VLSPNLAFFIDHLAAEIRKDHPDTVAHLSDFELKAAILDISRAYAAEQADTMIQAALLTEIVKQLSQLARLQP
jgi:hypothetical protein